MLAITEYINALYLEDQAGIVIVEGNPGYGKTAYGANALAETHTTDNIHGNWDLDVFKKHMGFHPLKVLEKWKKAYREKVFLWDDAGAWIHSLDYQDPLIKKIGKQLQTMRTKYSCIIFTCLDADDLAKKVRMHAGAITVRITLQGYEPQSPYISKRFKRTATAKHWEKDWYGKLFRNDNWKETYTCYMPPHFYNWYQPIRKSYSDLLTKLALKEAKKTPEVSSTVKQSDI